MECDIYASKTLTEALGVANFGLWVLAKNKVDTGFASPRKNVVLSFWCGANDMIDLTTQKKILAERILALAYV